MLGLVKDRLLGCRGRFTAGLLTMKGARGGTRTKNKVSIDKELMEVGRVAEGDKEEGCEWRDQIGGCGDFL